MMLFAFWFTLFLQTQPEIIDWPGIFQTGGIAGVTLIIWYYTFTKFFNRQEDYMKNLLEILKQENEYKQLLAGILTRMEAKLDMALQQRNNGQFTNQFKEPK